MKVQWWEKRENLKNGYWRGNRGTVVGEGKNELRLGGGKGAKMREKTVAEVAAVVEKLIGVRMSRLWRSGGVSWR